MHKLLFIALSFMMVFITNAAWALSLDDAKKQGLVGEQPNGYLGAVSATPDVQALVSDINNQRKEEYKNIAQKNGTTIAAVEALAGEKAIAKTSPGNYIRSSNGAWTKK